MSTSLILGIDGQLGSYLADLLLQKGCRVIGWVPLGIEVDGDNLDPLRESVTLVHGDLADQDSITGTLEQYQPDEIYNLAAPSFPAGSWDESVLVGDIAGLGVARILDAVRRVKPAARFYQASSSEMFGDPLEVPQDEETPFRPRNPYGIAKLYAHWTTVRYREFFGLHSVSGIMYNTESPRRGRQFVTRKIARAAARIKLGLDSTLSLGDLNARRDWGFAGDYVRAMWLMLQQNPPQDYVIGTGVTHSVRHFCELAFGCLDMDYRDYVVQDPRFTRPPERAQLVANPRKAHTLLDWHPAVTFEELVRMMVEAELARLKPAG